MKKTDLAYIAGLIDGEGCISIVKKKDLIHGSSNYDLRVSVNMTSEYLIQYLHFAFGGFWRERKKIEERHKQQWMWAVSGPKASEFLLTILPYLIIKKPQAELALRFQSTRRKGGYGQGIKKPEPISILEEADFLLMKSLKR